MILNCNLVSLKINSIVCKFSIETRLNPIPIFNQLCLFSLSHLIKLELSECRIQAIEGHAFQGLDSLEWLAIDIKLHLGHLVSGFFSPRPRAGVVRARLRIWHAASALSVVSLSLSL